MIPGGLASINRRAEPCIAFARAKGSRLWDLDGNEYIDCHAAFSAYILGHSDDDQKLMRMVDLNEWRSGWKKARRSCSATGEMVHYAGIDAALADNWRTGYHATTAFDDWPRCDFVVESVDEDPHAKQDVFDQVERVVAPNVPVASNTSAIPITQLQASRRHPQRFFGMHWFEPAYATRFLELIPGEKTSSAIMATAAAVARCCGKEPSVLAKDIPGFIVNRLGYAMYREALNLLELGVADVETIDRSFRNVLGVWSTFCGPFQWIDLTGGLELYAKAMARVLPTLSTATDLPSALRRLVDSHEPGATSGHRFYECTPEEEKRRDELFHAHAWRAYALMREYFPLENK